MNAEVAKHNHTEHSVTLAGRGQAEVKGVTDVISFDEQTVVLNTVCGGLTVEGTSLHIQVLNIEAGIVAMDGKIDALTYFETESSDKHEKSGFFGKIFR